MEGTSLPAELTKSGTASCSPPPLVTGETGEALSRRTAPGPNTGGGGDDVMAKVNTSVTEDQEGESLLVNKEGELG